MSNGIVNAAAGAVSAVLDAAGNLVNSEILIEGSRLLDVTFATETAPR
jgi:hypothetical protein